MSKTPASSRTCSSSMMCPPVPGCHSSLCLVPVTMAICYLLFDVKWYTSSPIISDLCDLDCLALSCCWMYLTCLSIREACTTVILQVSFPSDISAGEGKWSPSGCALKLVRASWKLLPTVMAFSMSFFSLDLPFNEAITLWIVWWWGGVLDNNTCMKAVKFFAAELYHCHS